ncbi:MFS transporter [Chloroflexota bacterium]
MGFPRIFFGWGLVATAAFISFWGAGFRQYGLSALFIPISTELEMTRAATSVVSSIGRIGGSFEGILVGWLADKIGPQRVIYFGILLFGLGMIIMNYVNSQWGFYLVWGIIMGLGFSASFGIPMNTAITNWFIKKRGIAQGARMMIPAAFALPIVTWLSTSYGWRVACVVGGVVWLIVGLTLTKLFVRDHRPEYYGLLPDGAQVDEDLKESTDQLVERGVRYASEVEEIEFTTKQAMRTPAYWFLILSQIGPGLTIGALMLHIIPLLTDMGISPAKAATMVTVSSLSSPAARLLSGYLTDRIGKYYLRFVLAGSFLLQGAGIGLFVLYQSITIVYPFLILYYGTLSVNLIVRPLVVGRYFGRKAIGSIQGTSMAIGMPLGIMGPIYLGWIFDTTGSYVTALTVITILLIISAVLMFMARPPALPNDANDT